MTTLTQLNQATIIKSTHGIADVWFNTITHHHSLHAVGFFNSGDIITNFYAATTQDVATYLTVQTAKHTHITLEPSFLQYVNHSCDPNVFFDTSVMQLVCLKKIQAGDELCFFYPSAEWQMAQPFVCNCGSDNCLQLINGAAQLDRKTLEKYRLTDFIIHQVNQQR